jgi:hypothetical protein
LILTANQRGCPNREWLSSGTRNNRARLGIGGRGWTRSRTHRRSGR